MHDGLPKLKDYPKEMGGSGEQVAEGSLFEVAA